MIEPEGIVVLNPNASLTREDFAGLSSTVDAYLASHSNIHGVIIHAKSFRVGRASQALSRTSASFGTTIEKSNEWRW